ncbi:MAG TPA: hypothetical protein DCQ76_05870 [Ruminococcaceae bacterium]|nr:hypothetical protein [Oscillospiraceae bacterium]
MKKNFDNKWYSDEFLNELKNTAYRETDGNLTYTVKYAPDAVSKYGIDPRMLGGPIGKMAKYLKAVPDFVFDRIHMRINSKSLEFFRKGCDRISYANCRINGVSLKDAHIKSADGFEIPIRIYKNPDCEKTRALLIFIHGGAFVGGSLEPYDESLKMFVDKFGIKVISIAYRLLPENAYPAPYNDCFDVLGYISKNADEFGVDKDKIFVCGDSAGGNIAQACTTKYKGTDVIRAQLLLYPTLNAFGFTDKYYRKGLSDYTLEPTQKALSKGVIRQMQILTNCNLKQIGINSPDEYNNPYSYSASGNAPTFITAGALDYLKKDAVAWAHKLKDAGVKQELVIYNGLGHGYLNATGVFPQAEDVIDEMGKFIYTILGE